MAKISTKNIPSGGTSVPKVIQPGDRIVKVLSVGLEKFPFKKNPEDPDAFHIVLNVEGPDLGEDFDGWAIDKNDPSKGKYKGQTGKIKASYYAFCDGETKGGVKISRDREMLKFLQNLCKEMILMNWFDAQDEKHNTTESLFEQFNIDKPFADKWIKICVAGKEYPNKQGYTNYDLFLPKYTTKTTVIELESVPDDKSRMVKYNEKDHIVKKKVDVVDSFGDEKPVIKKALSKDFDL